MMPLRKEGYSVIELLVVLALLAVLATVVTPLAQTVRQREREHELKRALWNIRDAIDQYRKAIDEVAPGSVDRTASGYPPSLQALASGLPDARAPGGRRLFLRSIPRDPFAPAELPAEATWKLRSFASDPERPTPGDDVYDVYSSSPALALDGVPLNQW